MLPICFPSEGDQWPALSKRSIDAARPSAERYFQWCSSLPGFGVRVYPSGRKVFVAQVRVGRGQRRVTIGAYGAFTVEQARGRASAIIQAAADGRDPQREKQETRNALTVAELCDEYLDAARAGLVMACPARRHRAALCKAERPGIDCGGRSRFGAHRGGARWSGGGDSAPEAGRDGGHVKCRGERGRSSKGWR